jgi:ABC-2 type transport system ATP-binding protein
VKLGTPADLINAGRGTEIRYRRNGEDVVVQTDQPTAMLHRLSGEALAEGRELEHLEVRRPTLEDVYLELMDGDEETA